VNATIPPMTDQVLLAEIARLLALIECHWTTHYSVGGQIDAFTVQQVHAVLAEHRQRLRTRGQASGLIEGSMITIEVEPDQAIAIVKALRAAADALASLPMPAGAGPDYWTEQAVEHRRLADSILTHVPAQTERVVAL